MRIYPARSFFRPGERIQLILTPEQPIRGKITADIYHLSDRVAQWEASANETSICLEGEVPAEARRGYLAQVQAGDQTVLTAFDVLESWTDAPRYGFLYDFSQDRTPQDIGDTLDHLLALHVNGLQFYDWQYRHDTLLPPHDAYIDPLGRALSLVTVCRLIEESHKRGMAALPYTAIYAASPEFAATHPDWQLFNDEGKPIDFAGGFLKLMNPCSPWQDHFVDECRKVLDALPFDGIHVDQYGEPRTGFDSHGVPIDISEGFAATLKALRQCTPPEKNLLFNLVHNWPAEMLAKSPLDFWYSELWPPVTSLKQIWQTIRDNRRLNARPAVLAVYIPPEWEMTVIAAQSMILAAGGSHIVHGDHGRYLSDPYFPKAALPGPRLAMRLQQLADFAVAYEEAFVFAEDVTDQWCERITVGGQLLEPGNLIVSARENRLYINLLRGEGHWNSELSPGEAQLNVPLSVPTDGAKRIWSASPTSPIAHPLPDLVLPSLSDWQLICIEY